MTEAQLVDATEVHALAFAPLLRPEELAELEASGVVDPLEMLVHGVRTSDLCLAAIHDGKVGAMIGVSSADPSILGRGRVGQMWFLTGTPFLSTPRPFLRVARRAVARMLELYPMVWNLIDARYEGALRLARSMGAELSSPVAYGPHGMNFVPFHIWRS
jgi:hypothetical protein